MCFDADTGEEFRDYVRERQARQAEAEARQAAERRARDEAIARQTAEERLRELEAELRRLRPGYDP